MKKFIRLAVLALAMVILLTGCAKTVNLDNVKKYADPITEKILCSINKPNVEIIKDLDEQMKVEMLKSNLLANINEKIGNYIIDSKVLKCAIRQNGIVTTTYIARFTKEQNDVTVKISFKNDNRETKITGLWFDSPKLRGN